MKKSPVYTFLAIAALVIALFCGAFAPQALAVPVAISAAAVLCYQFTLSLAVRRQMVTAVNIGEGFHKEALTKLADAPILVRYYLVKLGSDSAHIAACAASGDEPLGVCSDAPAAGGDPAAVHFLGATDDTAHFVSAGALNPGDKLYSNGDGRVRGTPTVAGVWWEVGTALTATTGADQEVEAESCKPRKVVVIAAFTAGATAAAVDLATSEALANALKADLATIRAALVTPAQLQVL